MITETEVGKFLEFDVTQEDIDCSTQGAPGHCAIAERLKKIEGIKNPSVCGSSIDFWLNEVWYHCSVHHRISEWISRFDHNRKSVSPMHVSLKLGPGVSRDPSEIEGMEDEEDDE